MRSSLLLQQCSACLVRLTLTVFVSRVSRIYPPFHRTLLMCNVIPKKLINFLNGISFLLENEGCISRRMRDNRMFVLFPSA